LRHRSALRFNGARRADYTIPKSHRQPDSFLRILHTSDRTRLLR
jgi:hypothetical protein